jgi:hypothetical protein
VKFNPKLTKNSEKDLATTPFKSSIKPTGIQSQ